jgi:starch synthase (maltosyl-transferring)
VQRQRYAFAAFFSAGLMMPIGYEFGFKKKLDVVSTHPTDWEAASFNLERFIGMINKLKKAHPLLHGEGQLRTVVSNRDILVLERYTNQASGQVAWILVNKSKDRRAKVILDDLALTFRHRLYCVYQDANSSRELPLSGQPLVLNPAEVLFLLES